MNSELKATLDSLLKRDFVKVAQPGMPMPMGPAAPMDPAMMGAAPPMDPAMMGAAPPMDPNMMPPEMLPPADMAMAAPPEGETDESAKGMKEVAIKALDMAQDTINAIMGAQSVSPDQMTDLAAATVSGSGALSGIPPEEIAALAQQQG